MTQSAPRPAFAAPEQLADALRLLETAEQLTALLIEESGLVRTLHISEITPLQADKTRLTATYAKTLRALAAPESRPLPASLKARLMAAAQKLNAAAADNERMLKVGRAATDRLIGTIVSAIKEARPATTGYTRNTQRGRSLPLAPAMNGIAVDRRM